MRATERIGLGADPMGSRRYGTLHAGQIEPVAVGIACAAAVAAVFVPPPLVPAAGAVAVAVAGAGALLTAERSRAAPVVTSAEYPRWVFVAVLLGAGSTTFLGVRLPGNLTPGDAFIGLAVAGLASRPRRTGAVMRSLPAWFWWSTSLVLVSGFIVLFRPEVSLAPNLAAVLKTWSSMAVVPLVIVAVATTRPRLGAVAAAFAVGAAINAAAAAAEALSLWNPSALLGVAEFWNRATGLSVHPNHLGLSCALAVPFAWGRMEKSTRTLARYGWLGVFGLLLVGVLASGSRAALAAALIGATAMMIRSVLRQRDARGRWVATVRLSVLILILGSTGLFLYSWVPGDQADDLFAIATRLQDPEGLDESNTARELFYGEGIADVERRWLVGRGFADSTHDHNIFLQMLLSGGVTGLAGLVLYLLGGVRTVTRERSLLAMSMSTAALVAFALWPIAGMVQNNLRDRYLFVSLGVLLGYGCVQKGAPLIEDVHRTEIHESRHARA